MKSLGIIFYLILFTTLCLNSQTEKREDIRGSKDHQLISRFPGSYIKFYSYSDFNTYLLPLGKVVKDRALKKKKPLSERVLEGKVTRITYFCPRNKSTLEIYRNYEQELKAKKFKKVFSGHGMELEEKKNYWASTIYSNYGGKNHLRGNPADHWYISASIQKGECFTVIAVNVSRGWHKWPVAHVDIIECRKLKADKIKIDSEYLKNSLDNHGHLVIRGLLFNYNTTDIKPGSDLAVNKIALFLKQNPDVKLYIVGHTDSTGSLRYNMELSLKRAQKVVYILTQKHNIAPERLEAHGVAHLAPITGNSSDEGRALNRRVEIVLKK